MCTISTFPKNSDGIQLYLIQGTQILGKETQKKEINHSMVALAKDPGEFECRFKIGKLVKVTNKTVSVAGEWTKER